MVLGAGVGSRLASLRLGVPKILAPVSGRPLLAAQLEYLHAQGIDRVVVNAHHRADAVEAFASAYTGPVELTVVTEPRLLGTAGGVRNALPALAVDRFFVLYGDVVVSHPLGAVATAHVESGAAATVTVYETDAIRDKGTVEVKDGWWVRRFVEKDPSVRPPALVNAGLYLIERQFVADLRLGEELDFGHDVFPAALERDERILAYRLPEPVIDVGTPEGLARAGSLPSTSSPDAAGNDAARS